ncbi:hypothetical protein E3U43_016327 [Larimichthys crocea]|uniref:Uncharacterized protein n=1 Tax=Larimichthys crocea TaxID=215358 RepID=A0ACD3QHI5_LARCR|nr:hypothetical protein E3U43_016327 [Larimichthys crocea]
MKRGVHKGQDSRSPKPASALRINPSGPGICIIPCRSIPPHCQRADQKPNAATMRSSSGEAAFHLPGGCRY